MQKRPIFSSILLIEATPHPLQITLQDYYLQIITKKKAADIPADNKEISAADNKYII